MERAQAQITAHSSHARTQYSIATPHLLRRNFRRLWHVDAPTIELGKRITDGTAAVAAKRQREKRTIRSAQRAVRASRLNVNVDHRNASRAQAAAELARQAYEDGEETNKPE
jgi:hypothetical protein